MKHASVKVALLRELDESQIAKIRKHGVQVVKGHDYEADIALVSGTFPEFPRYKKLKWVHTSFSGVDGLLTDELKRSRVLLTNSRGAASVPIAEHVFAFILAFERQLMRAFRNKEESQWERISAGEIQGKTMGIVGLGNIGSEAAKRAKAFGCRVVAATKESHAADFVDETLPPEKLDKLLRSSDYVVICAPLTKETMHMIGKKELASMKKSALIVNVGRGAVIDEKALAEALQKKQIRGACLDVFEEEPLPKSSPLWKMDNVIITSHYSGNSPHYGERVTELFCSNLDAFLTGKEMKNVVDLKRGY